MHSLTHSLTHEEIRAKFAHRKDLSQRAEMMNPDFTDILLPEEVEYLAATRIDSFNRDRKAAVREKARTFVDTSDQAEAIRYQRKRSPHWFVTINPRPEVDWDELHATIIDVLSQPEITDPLWCYEQRNENGGLHAHILLTTSNIGDNFYNRKFKGVFIPELCKTPDHVIIKYVPEKDLEKVKSYIRKTYVAKSKNAANKATIAWRKKGEFRMNLRGTTLLVCPPTPN